MFATPQHSPFVPADAGTQPLPNRTTCDWSKAWIPASAGMNGECCSFANTIQFAETFGNTLIPNIARAPQARR